MEEPPHRARCRGKRQVGRVQEQVAKQLAAGGFVWPTHRQKQQSQAAAAAAAALAPAAVAATAATAAQQAAPTAAAAAPAAQ